MKVIFLDIDGVLNSFRTAVAYNGYGHLGSKEHKCDPVAIAMLQRLCKETNAKVVISSTWRIGGAYEDFAFLGVPVIDTTPVLSNCIRGDEIYHWVEITNSTSEDKVTHYIILDDDSDMLESQMLNFIKVDHNVGFSFDNYQNALKILGVENDSNK